MHFELYSNFLTRLWFQQIPHSPTKQPSQRITRAWDSKKPALELPQHRKRQKKSSHINALSTLPDPYLPPPHRDNTSLWPKIMAKADTSQHTASTYGANGTADYDNLLEIITGTKLSTVSKYYYSESSSKHFDKILDSVQKVEQ